MIRRRIIYVIVVAIVSLLIISGCVGAPPKATPMPTSTQLPTGTPAPIAVTPSPTAISVTPAIRVTTYPARVEGESNFTIRREVTGGLVGEISHSTVHWGFRTGRANMTDYGRFSGVQTGKTPQEFSAGLVAPESGTVYFRAHAIVDGEDLYSDEYVIAINPR